MITRELAKWFLEHPDIHKAYAEGRMLQILSAGQWVDVEDPSFGAIKHFPDDYRVKPEPKYRPYTKEECNAVVGRVARWNGGVDIFRQILSSSPNGVVMAGYDKNFQLSAETLLAEYTIDGHPAGKLDDTN